MKAIVQTAALLAIIILTGCSGGAGKFTGKWREINGGSDSKVLIIEKKGEKYDVYPENKPENFISMEYDKDHDMLTVHDGNMMFDVMYNKETKRIKAGPRGDDQKEFEKIK